MTERTSRPESASRLALILALAMLVTFPRVAPAQAAGTGVACRAAPGTEANVAVFSQWIDDVWFRGQLALVTDLVGPAYLRHEADGSRTVTPAQYVVEIAALRQRFPDVRFHVHDCDAVGDRLWTRWTMVGTNPETGQVVRRMGAQVYRLAGGRLVETWVLVFPTDAGWPEQGGEGAPAPRPPAP